MVKTVIKSVIILIVLFIVLNLLGMGHYIYLPILLTPVYLLHTSLVTKNNKWSIFLADMSVLGILLVLFLKEVMDAGGEPFLWGVRMEPLSVVNKDSLLYAQVTLVLVYVFSMIKALLTFLLDKGRKYRTKRKAKGERRV